MGKSWINGGFYSIAMFNYQRVISPYLPIFYVWFPHILLAHGNPHLLARLKLQFCWLHRCKLGPFLWVESWFFLLRFNFCWLTLWNSGLFHLAQSATILMHTQDGDTYTLEGCYPASCTSPHKEAEDGYMVNLGRVWNASVRASHQRFSPIFLLFKIC